MAFVKLMLPFVLGIWSIDKFGFTDISLDTGLKFLINHAWNLTIPKLLDLLGVTLIFLEMVDSSPTRLGINKSTDV